MCIRDAPRRHETFVTSTDEEGRTRNEAAFREANEAIRTSERGLEPPLDRDEDVIEDHGDYLVVRNPDCGGAVARALDPRGDDA